MFIIGIVNTENSVVKKTHCEANVMFEPYWFAIMAVFAAAGIDVITIGIAAIMLSSTRLFSKKNTANGSNISLMNVTK